MQVAVAGARRRGGVVINGASDKSPKEAVKKAAETLVKQIQGLSLQLAINQAALYRAKASNASSAFEREHHILAASAILGQGRDPYLDQRFGVDRVLVRDLLTRHRRWPPIALPRGVTLPAVNKTAIERGIDAGKISTPISLDEEDRHNYLWMVGRIRNSYLLDTDRIHELELGWKFQSAETMVRLGLPAFGGDGGSFDWRAITRFRGHRYGWFTGFYLSIDVGDEPEDPMVDRGVFAGLGVIIGTQVELGPLRLSAHLAPNAFQIFGSGDQYGTSRVSPLMAEADLFLPLGLTASAGAGYYLGAPQDSQVWQLHLGWRFEL
jgi:hypothetical protein